MSDVDGKDQDLLVKHVIRQFMKDQLNEFKGDKQADNNSFVFLENSTLNMLIVYLLMGEKRRAYAEVDEEGIRFIEVKVLEKLENFMEESKKEFEAVITLLKEKI